MTTDQLATSTPAQIVMATKEAFTRVGISEQQFNREAGFAIQMFRNNPYLAQMDKQSIRDAVVNVALTGLTLNPELRLGYLIPRKNKLYFQSSYMGKREILLRSGMVKDVWCELVYKNDFFKMEAGTDRKLIHEPLAFGERGEIVGGYWCAILQNGERPFGVMTKAEIDAISQRSESVKSGGQSPWKTDYNEMAKKTIINRAFKSLPKTGISDDCLRAIEADSELDNADFAEWKAKQTPEVDPLEDDAPYADEVTEPQQPAPAVTVAAEPKQAKVEPKLI